MTRNQRRLHQLIWFILAPSLIALFVYFGLIHKKDASSRFVQSHVEQQQP